MTAAVATKPDLRPPPEPFYWARLDGLPRRAGQEARRFAFEAWLPAPLEEVETRFAPLLDGAWLACGIDHATLDGWLAQRPDLESIRPERLPSCLGIVDPSGPRSHDTADEALRALEFRSGRRASARARRRRTALGFAAGAAWLAAVTLVVTGSLRRAHADRAATANAEASTLALAASSLQHPAAGVDPRLQLEAALRTAERTRRRPSAASLAEDRTDTYLGLLAAWPEAYPTRLERLEIDQEIVGVSGHVRDAGDAERIILTLGGFSAGWQERSRSAARAREGYGYSVTLGRASDIQSNEEAGR